MLVVSSKLIEKTFAGFDSKGVGVVGEVTVLEHVIDVVPNRLKRDAEFTVVVHYFFSLAPVLVTLLYVSAHVDNFRQGV